MRKKSLRLLAIVLFGAILAACAAPAATTEAPAGDAAQGADAAADSAAATGEKQTLDLWFNSDDAFNQFNEQVIADFEAANPDIDIVYSPYPNEAYKTNLQVAIGSDAPPDIFFNWAGDDTGRYAREGHLLDLAPYAEQYDWASQVSPAMLDAFTSEGTLYGAPYSQEAKYFYYHLDLFDQLGLSVPTTFDELLDTCRAIREAGMVPLAFGNQERWEGVHYMTIFNQKMAGEDTIAADYALTSAPDVLFTDPGYVEAFNQLLAMQEAGCFGDAVNSTTPDAASILFSNQQTVMYYQGTWLMGALKENGLEGKYGMFRMPPITSEAAKGNQNYVLAGPVGLEVSAKTEYPDAAAKFVDFYISQPVQSALLLDTNRIPVRQDAVDKEQAPAGVVAVTEDLAAGEGTALWLDVVLDNSISEVYLNSIQEVLAGTKTPEQAVEAVRAQALKVQESRTQQ
jgi:raffinose/stachyose/melibiose transport system substrate-binding protein